jgi:RNA polymerase sigma-70 factor (ECF subfamily)
MDSKGDIFSIEGIYMKYSRKMVRFACEYVVSKDDAEDIVQNVFMELLERRLFFAELAALETYLFTAVKNRSLNHLRDKLIKQKASEHIQEEYIYEMKANINSLESFDEELFADEKAIRELRMAIDILPDICKKILLMSKIEGKKQKVIAEELNISINTVESQIGIAYRKLRSILIKRK